MKNKRMIFGTVGLAAGIIVVLLAWQLFNPSVSLAEEDARRIVQEKYAGEIISLTKNKGAYLVELAAESGVYHIEVNADNGKIRSIVQTAHFNTDPDFSDSDLAFDEPMNPDESLVGDLGSGQDGVSAVDPVTDPTANDGEPTSQPTTSTTEPTKKPASEPTNTDQPPAKQPSKQPSKPSPEQPSHDANESTKNAGKPATNQPSKQTSKPSTGEQTSEPTKQQTDELTEPANNPVVDPATKPTQPDNPRNGTNNALLTKREAIAIAEQHTGGEADDVDLIVPDHASPYYLVEVEWDDDDTDLEADVEIDAYTGEIKSITWDED